MDRFWSKVNKGEPDECWEWTASLGTKGYGQFGYEGKILGAHRVAYLLTHGEIPNGKQIAHTCHNKLCCNPAHLEAQTNSENSFANYQDGRHKFAVVTEVQIKEIVSLQKQGAKPTAISKKLGLKLGTVEGIVYRRYRHVERVEAG